MTIDQVEGLHSTKVSDASVVIVSPSLQDGEMEGWG